MTSKTEEKIRAVRRESRIRGMTVSSCVFNVSLIDGEKTTGN